jgi:hypothetical protein
LRIVIFAGALMVLKKPYKILNLRPKMASQPEASAARD